ncbi:MAG: UDP-N-acetylmuramate:L-alanyl-gamma-D-glutamyl-meso-diaminopimelate ligase [Nitrosomonadales bacterium]
MHIHILGICGTFMAGIATIAKQLGHKVTGCDQNVYPPMSTFLESQDIKIIEGYDASQIVINADLYVIGNVVSRGNPLMEKILDKNLQFISGPQWLHENVLKNKWVLAVSGTHGKTTTTSMLTWILEEQNYKPDFLIGGIPKNMGVSARTQEESNFFVIEADEYDTAFFDKRSKFIHYYPKTLVINNIEFDHADIFENIEQIQKHFHHLVRLVPSSGLLITNALDKNIDKVISMGHWTESQKFNDSNGWHVLERSLMNKNDEIGKFETEFYGEHNYSNALAAILAAQHVGVKPVDALKALSKFSLPARRLEKLYEDKNIVILDDFAHHPSAISSTLKTLKNEYQNKKIMAVIDPRSNTMKRGDLKNELVNSFLDANKVFFYNKDLKWDPYEILRDKKIFIYEDIEKLYKAITDQMNKECVIVFMSNGSFDGLQKKIKKYIADEKK